jgi:hypothetical protein
MNCQGACAHDVRRQSPTYGLPRIGRRTSSPETALITRKDSGLCVTSISCPATSPSLNTRISPVSCSLYEPAKSPKYSLPFTAKAADESLQSDHHTPWMDSRERESLAGVWARPLNSAGREKAGCDKEGFHLRARLQRRGLGPELSRAEKPHRPGRTASAHPANQSAHIS